MKRASPISEVRGSDALFPNDFGEDLLLLLAASLSLIKCKWVRGAENGRPEVGRSENGRPNIKKLCYRKDARAMHPFPP